MGELSAQKSTQKSKPTQKNAFLSNTTLLSAQKSSQKSAKKSAQKSAQRSAQKSAQKSWFTLLMTFLSDSLFRQLL